MKQSHRIFNVSIFLIFLLGCDKKNASSVQVPTDNYVAFGQYYGECEGEECKEMYRIGNDALFEDSLDKYPKFNLPFDGVYGIRSNEKYLIVKNFESKIPDQLFSEVNHVIGQPDAGDWGGLYIEVCKNGVRNFWYIDKKKSNVPDYLHSLVDEISANVEALK